MSAVIQTYKMLRPSVQHVLRVNKVAPATMRLSQGLKGERGLKGDPGIDPIVSPDEPVGAEIGTFWFDTDAIASNANQAKMYVGSDQPPTAVAPFVWWDTSTPVPTMWVDDGQ